MATTESYTLKKTGDRVWWRVRYRTVDNRSTVKSSFENKKDATNWGKKYDLAKYEGKATSPRDRKQPLGPFIDLHVARTIGLTAATQANRQSIAKTWVSPDWEKKQIGSILKTDVQAWLELITSKNAGPATAQKAHGILLASLQKAVESKALTTNPAKGVDVPRPIKRAHEYLNHHQVAELAGAIDPRYKTVIGILAYCGLRFGELTALRAGEVDLKSRRIHVVRAATTVNGHMVEGLPKFEKFRKVFYPEFLDEAMAVQVEKKARTALVFTAPRGGYLRLDDWRVRAFADAKETLSVRRTEEGLLTEEFVEPFPNITPHDLRHTAASLSVSAGGNVKAIQIMLGHASASMTLDVYADLFSDDEEGVAIALHEQAMARIGPGVWSL
ncbi:site-specific integrase [Cryobacterium lactosi]|uniref:Site-specific integrase n=1 Tax=Cryobacterium lactosi TaxID=1259202 RepID=A0A4R9BYB5_9MICO|nr:site-specific integrase [Cryobacterium lactosi]TFD93986.1 site-specific integrase [Cryobacterium lactosi]